MPLGHALSRGRRLGRALARPSTYFDGPFDQHADDFIADETLRDIIFEVDPRLKGKIDRLGNFADGEPTARSARPAAARS